MVLLQQNENSENVLPLLKKYYVKNVQPLLKKVSFAEKG